MRSIRRHLCGRRGGRLLITAAFVALIGRQSVLSTPRSAESHAGSAATIANPALPLAFEVNRGQHSPRVRYAARGAGYDFALLDNSVSVRLRNGERDAAFVMRFAGASAQRLEGADPLSTRVHYFLGDDPSSWHRNIPTYARVRYQGLYPGIDAVLYGNNRQLEYDFLVAAGADASRIRVALDGVEAVRVNATGELEVSVSGHDIRYTRPVAYQDIKGHRRVVPATYIVDGTTVAFRVGNYDRTQQLVIDPVLVYSTYFGGSARDGAIDVATDAAGNTYVAGSTASTDFPVTASAYQQSLPSVFSAAFISKINRDGTAILYSTYLGGHPSNTGGHTRATDLAVDVNGAAYVSGCTASSTFPTTAGAHQPTYGGGIDRLDEVFAAKLSAAGDALVYSTYLGGSDDECWGESGIAVDIGGNAYVVGDTESTDFPVTAGAFRTTYGPGRSGFLVKLNGSGGATYATYLGVTGTASAVAVDTTGHAYVTGLSAGGLGTSPGAFQTTFGGNWDAYVAKVNPTGTALTYATYLGTADFEVGTDIAVDPYGRAYVVGWTNARTTFPVTAGAFQSANAGPPLTEDGFLAVLLEGGDRLWYSTLFGGSSDDRPTAVDLDQWMRATIVGWTLSPDYPLQSALQPTHGGGELDGFVTTIKRGGDALEYSSYLGGSGGEIAEGVAVASAARTTIVGITGSSNFPTVNPLRPAQSCAPQFCEEEGFITQMAPARPGSVSGDDIVLYAADATVIAGEWDAVEDPTAAGGIRLHHPNANAPKVAAPLASPNDYFEVTARIRPETPYTVWIRGKAENNDWNNDSVYLQFSNAIEGDNPDEEPHPNYVYQIGSTNAMTFVLEDCNGCGLDEWAWVDSGYGFKVAGPIVTDFGSEEVTIRIQTREDGVSIDQIVLAPFGSSPYAVQAPGFQKLDDTILPRQHGGSPGGEPAPIPAGWQSGDIGAVSAAGSASYDASTRTFTIVGSGADIWGTADELHFAHTSVTGDFSVETRVASVENVHAWTKAGLMLREHTGAGARHASLFVTPTNVKGIAYQRRPVENGTSISHAASGGNFHPPMWIRLTRVGNTVSASYRWTTAEPWVDFGQQTFESLAASLLVGLAVSSHVDGQLATATFDNFGVTPIVTPPPPGGLPAGWSCGDLGAVAAAGSCAFEDQEFTEDFLVNGSGADIWGTADELSYARHAASGDFSFTARVKSVENVDRWTKAGIMIRDWNGAEPAPAGARHASFFVTPSLEKGTAFQRRPTQDGASVHTAGPVLTAPIWLRLVRTGDTISAYYRKESTDAWTLVGSQTFAALPNDLSAMLVVSSHVDGTLAQARFDSVEIVQAVPLQSVDIGTTTAGSTTVAGEETILAANGADIWGTADAFRFHYTEWVGDGMIMVRVRSLQETHAWAKAGVMIRESLDPGSKQVMAIVSASRGIATQWRAETGAISASSTPKAHSAPIWLAVRRTGNRFNTYYSVDGVIWQGIAPEVTVTMGERVYLGLPATSHSTGTLTTAVFDDIIIRR